MRKGTYQSHSIRRRIISIVLSLTLVLTAFAVMPVTAAAAGQDQAGQGVAGGYPFLLGAAKGPSNEPVPLMTYKIGSKPGTIIMDGNMPDLLAADTFAQFATHPDSNHLDGIAYIWINDDADNVYFTLDWTTDNTYDYGDDYFKVFLNDGTGIRTYTQHTDPVGGAYGESMFMATPRADYDHMVYVIAVPKSELNSDVLKVGFELYGTAHVDASLTWTQTPPAIAAAGASVSYQVHYNVTSQSNMNAMMFLIEYQSDADLAFFQNNYYGFDETGLFYLGGSPYLYFTEPGIKILARTPFTISTSFAGDVALSSAFQTGTHKVAAVALYSYGGSGTYYGYKWNANILVSEIVVTDNGLPAAIAPTITGPTTMSLTAGYAATSTGTYTVTGTTPVAVTKTAGDANITWNDATKKLDIAAGLAAGTYPVTLTASNGTLPDATLNFTLTVKNPVSPGGGGTVTPPPAQPSTEPAITTPAGIDSASVKLFGNGGKFADKKTTKIVAVASGTKLGEVKKPARKGYQFMGWYTKKTGGMKYSAETVILHDMKIYAHWARVATVNVGSGSKLALLAKASAGSKVLAKYSKGTKLIILSSKAGFYKVKIKGKTGYMAKRYVKLAKTK